MYNKKQRKGLRENFYDECSPNQMSVPVDKNDPLRVNLNISAAGKDHVNDLLAILKNAGLENAAPVSQEMMPYQSSTGSQEMIPYQSSTGSQKMMPAQSDSCGSKKSVSTNKIDIIGTEGYDNEPNPEHTDHTTMTQDLSGGLNRRKKQYSKAEDGDNAMSVFDMKEHIRRSILQRLSEKKSSKKPDFLDLDGDGNTKEPISTAAKNAKANRFKKGKKK